MGPSPGIFNPVVYLPSVIGPFFDSLIAGIAAFGSLTILFGVKQRYPGGIEGNKKNFGRKMKSFVPVSWSVGECRRGKGQPAGLGGLDLVRPDLGIREIKYNFEGYAV